MTESEEENLEKAAKCLAKAMTSEVNGRMEHVHPWIAEAVEVVASTMSTDEQHQATTIDKKTTVLPEAVDRRISIMAMKDTRHR